MKNIILGYLILTFINGCSQKNKIKEDIKEITIELSQNTTYSSREERYVLTHQMTFSATNKEIVFEKKTKSCSCKMFRFQEPIDIILKRELEQKGIEDQTLRFLLPDVIKKFGRESAEYNYNWSLIYQQDSICVNSEKC